MAETVTISPRAQPELVNRLRAGSVDAFTEIYQANAEKLLNFSYNILQDKETCRDLIQDVFLSLWTRRESLQLTSTLEAYLHGAVKLKTLECIRNGKVREGVFDQIEKRIWGEPATENLVYQRELQAKLAQAISDLPEKAREVYRLSREGGFSHQQIADQLFISPKTVENHLTTALKKIRASLGDLLPLILLFLGGK